MLLAAASRSNVVTFQSSGFSEIFKAVVFRRLFRFAATSSYVLSDHLPSTASAVRQVGINRSPGADPPIGPKEEDGPGVTAARAASDSARAPTRAEFGGRTGSGRVWPRLESFLTAGSLDSCTVWGADADRSKLRGGATPSWWRSSGLQRLEPHPSALDPPSQKG